MWVAGEKPKIIYRELTPGIIKNPKQSANKGTNNAATNTGTTAVTGLLETNSGNKTLIIILAIFGGLIALGAVGKK